MKLNLETKLGLTITPETEFESDLINDNFFKTKICFLESSDKKGFSISFEDRFKIDLKQGAILPSSPDAVSTIYLLRVIIDSYLIHNSVLPLHAAFIHNETNDIFLMGGTKSGKSILSKKLMDEGKYCPVGDDHLLIADDKVFGNSNMGIRSFDNSKQAYYLNSAGYSFNDPLLLYLSIGNKNRFEPLDLNLISDKTYLNSILKYVYNPFYVGSKHTHINDETNFDVVGSAKKLLLDFVNSSKTFYRLDGSINYMFKTIKAVNSSGLERKY